MVKIGPLEFTVQTLDAHEVAQRRQQMPEPGRCADRIEDFFKVLSGGWNNSWEQHRTVFSSMVECLRSDEGDEPRDKYVLLTCNDPYWKDHVARPSKFARLRALQEQEEREAEQLRQKLALLRQQHAKQQEQEQQQQRSGQSRWSWLWLWRRKTQPLAPAEATAD